MENKTEVKRTERGWPGHFICAYKCLFRRNTLLEYKDIKIVVSTVGMMRDIDKNHYEIIGYERYYETMAFHALKGDKYDDIDVERQVEFYSPWSLNKIEVDLEADEMHEKVVEELSRTILTLTEVE
jgi:hypothetical protein